jgi:hypothetical protein
MMSEISRTMRQGFSPSALERRQKKNGIRILTGELPIAFVTVDFERSRKRSPGRREGLGDLRSMPVTRLGGRITTVAAR